MNESFSWVLILVLTTMGAIIFLHSRLAKAEQHIRQDAMLIAKAAQILEEMLEEQERVANILANYVAWEENDDGQTKTGSADSN